MVNKLSNLLLMVIAPILIITSFQLEFDSKMLLELFQAIAVALLSFLFLIILITLQINQTLAMTELVAIACPTAASTTLLAIKYEKDSGYASEIFAVTTVLSIITLPLIVIFGMMFL